MADDGENAELARLITLLRARAAPQGRPLSEARKAMEELCLALPVASDLSPSPIRLGGVPGLRIDPPGARTGRALLYLHGGAYVLGSAATHRGLAGELARGAEATAYVLDYRLAPEHPMPAAIEDGVAAYRALLDQGVQPSHIAFVGDSAGGGLTVATLVAARDAGLPLPAAAAVVSPWVDLECRSGSITSKAAEDPVLIGAILQALAGLYLAGASARDPRGSPFRANLDGLPPLLIQVGSAEILLDDALRLAAAAGAAGVAVTLTIWPRMIHVWHLFAPMLATGQRAILAAGVFLQAHLAA